MTRIKALQKMLTKSEKLREEIEQIFIDADYWNAHVRKPGEDRIDPDPHGTMLKIADELDRAIPNLKSQISILKP